MRSVLAFLLLAAVGILPAAAADRPAGLVRIATFNCSLNRAALGDLRRDLATPDNVQARAVAEIIQRVRPDILLLQEFDYDAEGASLRDFQANYLGRPQNGAEAIQFAHSFFTESNTGQPSGFDLNNDGEVGGGQDALGFGEFPGQYAMALLSRFPIDHAQARTFRKFVWRDMPGAMLPADWYSAQELAVLPLSSKSHWDVPVRIGKHTLHLLASHPTPPAFDGPEDRNGKRNHDEIRFWNDYLTKANAGYIRDDAGKRGGFRGKAFLIMGDQNSDPVDGASIHGGIGALLAHPRVDSSFVPQSAGAAEASAVQGGANAEQRGDPHTDTADFNDRVAGNLRVDYLLPSKGLRVCDGGVYWPAQAEPAATLVWGDRPAPSSDHRLVWLDVSVSGARCPPGSDPTTSGSSHPGR
ncbi:MAG TPA: endonuclease/exonuclease/phosphatase family protein [Steroidobacteraceae bacterium]